MGQLSAAHTVIASIGNPEPYLNTLHSAGHIALECLRQELRLPPFKPQRPFYLRTPALTTGNDQYTLMRSPMRMNESGVWVEQVWRGVSCFHDDYGGVPGLVLLHDMLNMPLGKVKFRHWESRSHGHNGLKSVEHNMPREDYPTAALAKLAIGVGSPPSYKQERLVRFLLQPLTEEQEDGFARVGPLVWKSVQMVEKFWETEGFLDEEKDEKNVCGGEVDGQNELAKPRSDQKRRHGQRWENAQVWSKRQR